MGLKDAREACPALMWAGITNHAYRTDLLRQGSQDEGRVFIVAVALDAINQFIVQHGMYVLELLVVATLLAIVISNRPLRYNSRSGQWHQSGGSARLGCASPLRHRGGGNDDAADSSVAPRSRRVPPP